MLKTNKMEEFYLITRFLEETQGWYEISSFNKNGTTIEFTGKRGVDSNTSSGESDVFEFVTWVYNNK